MIRYKITIEKITVEESIGSSWEKQYGDEVYSKMKDAESVCPPQYTWVDKKEQVERNETIYQQTKENNLDLIGVINAINKEKAEQ